MEHIQIGANYSHEEIATYIALFKELCDIFSWSYKEMHDIDPYIFFHEIRTYPYAKPIWKKIQPVHPRKEIENEA